MLNLTNRAQRGVFVDEDVERVRLLALVISLVASQAAPARAPPREHRCPLSALRGALRRLAAGESLTADETAAAFGSVMRGEGTAAQVAALLMGLRVKGETAAEVAGGARALRDGDGASPGARPRFARGHLRARGAAR